MARKSRIVLGLNSGTSADGVDAVACEIAGRGLAMRVQVLGHIHRRYPPDLRRRLMAVMAPAQSRTEELCRLHTEVGLAFARTASAAIKKLGLRRVDLVGAHGQTVCHLPPGSRPGSAAASGSMQIGDAATIATALRSPVVSQFRQADMAVGGQGAPLVPWTDHVLFRHRHRNRIIQNIGGIANLTWLPAGGGVENVAAFDTGPGNMIIDALVQRFTRNQEHFDRNGRRAARGKTNTNVLRSLMDHPYLDRPPPKSCGRETFGEAWLRPFMKRHEGRRMRGNDWIATATAFTAASIVLAYAVFLDQFHKPRAPNEEPRASARAAARTKKTPNTRQDRPPIDEIILCGGGTKNETLVHSLRAYLAFDKRFENARITTTAEYGIDPQAKESVSFAMLAAACVDRLPANLPQTTGARRPVVLGQICNPEAKR